MADEKTPLLEHEEEEDEALLSNGALDDAAKVKLGPVKRLSSGIAGALRAIISTIFAPGYYIIALFYDDHGNFSAAMPFHRLRRNLFARPKRSARAHAMAMPSRPSADEKNTFAASPNGAHHPDRSTDTSSAPDDSPARHTRSHSTSSSASSEPDDADESRPKRAIRIKTLSDEAFRQRDRRSGHLDSSGQPALTVDNIKSPTSASSASKLTRYPRAPAPPRPLIPKRQPSYSSHPAPYGAPQKTLIIDLDETLIHSMAKGGRMSTGHMVEVKLQTAVGVGSNVLGPQVPILYWVNKRPHCDEFLRKVSKWYNLIVFTASVQEYADPVVDWLELERKYFSARYYRQHCTFRNGAYIKDLSHVEPDLSKVMILDNSPMSYVFHEDNAIPIEGWISDPTDNDLLHLLPMLEGLQYTTDVRSLLALRLGEASSP